MKKENGQTKRVDNKRKNKTPTPYKKGTKYRQKRKSTSIYFLLWAVFSAFAFVILLALGFTQNFLFAQTYKREIAKDVNQKGDRIVANGSVSVMLQFGEATALSPKNELGTYMEFTDLTSGALIGDGDILPLNHNVFIPGNGRTAILCTGEHGIYIFVGGDYTVVKAEPVA